MPNNGKLPPTSQRRRITTTQFERSKRQNLLVYTAMHDMSNMSNMSTPRSAGEETNIYIYIYYIYIICILLYNDYPGRHRILRIIPQIPEEPLKFPLGPDPLTPCSNKAFKSFSPELVLVFIAFWKHQWGGVIHPGGQRRESRVPFGESSLRSRTAGDSVSLDRSAS